ncbi:MAG: Gfo/Idh/MocA family oxidoreductase [Nitrososphaerota archaeon]
MSYTPRLLLVGCGLMGKRHIGGIYEIRKSGLFRARLVGVVDAIPERASEAAQLAEKMLGERPMQFSSLHEAERAAEFEAADICTDPATHHKIAQPLLERGVSCIVEKPLSPTVRGCKLMLDAANRGGGILALAENYRRDPANRLAKWMIEGGELGGWLAAAQIVVGGGDNVLLTPWRHKKSGGILIDLCCHYTDIFLYYFGPPSGVQGSSALLRRTRYERRVRGDSVEKTSLEAEAEDFLSACYFYGGAVATLFVNLAASGEGIWRRTVYLEEGSIDVPMERTGEPVKTSRPSDSDYLTLRPHTVFTGQRTGTPYSLSPSTAAEVYDKETRALFPGLINGYKMDFWEVDRKLIALELLDFLRCVVDGGRPETGGFEGMLSVAMVLAALESSHLGRTVSLDGILELKTERYQERINKELGLVSDK